MLEVAGRSHETSSLSSLQGEIQQYVYKWEANCRSTFGSITFFNPALQDIANAGNLSVLEANPSSGLGGGRPSHGVTKSKDVFVAQ